MPQAMDRASNKANNTSRVKLHVFVSPQMYQDLQVLYAQYGLTMQDGVVGMLRNELKNVVKPPDTSWAKRTPAMLVEDLPPSKARRIKAILDADIERQKRDWAERCAADAKAGHVDAQPSAPLAPSKTVAPPAAQSAPVAVQSASVSQQFAHDYWPDYPEQVDWSKMTDMEQVRHYIRSREWNDPLPTGPATEAERAGMMLYKGITDVQLYRKMVRAEMKNKWEQEVLGKFKPSGEGAK